MILSSAYHMLAGESIEKFGEVEICGVALPCPLDQLSISISSVSLYKVLYNWAKLQIYYAQYHLATSSSVSGVFWAAIAKNCDMNFSITAF